MTETPEAASPTPQRSSRRKRLFLITGLSLIALALILSLSLTFYVKSGRLDRYVQEQVKLALGEYGLRAEFGEFELLFGTRTANVRDVKIFNQETGELVAAVDSAKLVVDIPNLYAPELRRKVVFKTIDLTNLQAYVTIDEQGLSNFRGLRGVPPRAPGRVEFDFAELVGNLDGGTVHVSDRSRRFEGELGNLKASARPIPDAEAVEAQLTAGPGRVVYQGRETSVESLELVGRLGEAGAEIEKFVLRSPLGEATVAGRVDDWRAPRPDMTVQARVALGEASRVFAPEADLLGSAAFDGRVTGEGTALRIVGAATADELVAGGSRVEGAKVESVDIQLDGGRTTFAASRATADAVVSSGTSLAGVAASDVRGELAGGETQASASRVSIGSVAASQARLSGLSLADVTASVRDGRTTFAGSGMTAASIVAPGARLTRVTAGGVRGEVAGGSTRATVRQVTVAGLATSQGRLDGVSLRGVTASVQGGRYRVTGDLGLAGGVLSGVRLGRTRGHLVADNGTVTLERFDAAVAGGTASGTVAVRTARGGTSRLSARFAGVRTDELSRLVDLTGAPLSGVVTGQANITWPGTNVDAASGTLTAHLDAETQQAAGAIPVTGDVAVRARGGTFDVDQLVLATDASRVEATGSVSRRGDSDLTFSVTSTNAAQLLELAQSVGTVARVLQPYDPKLAGDFSFKGRLAGPLDDPTIEGDLNASQVGVLGDTLGALTGHVRVTPTDVAFEGGTLAAANGGTAKFEYAAPRAETATSGRFDATLDRIGVGTVTTIAGVSKDQTYVSGELSGEVHVTGLPAAPTGKAEVNLVNGTVGGQPAEVAAASVVFDGRSARIERAELRTAQGQFVADGEYEFESKNFRLDARAENVDLSRLNVAAARLSGVVSGTARITGSAKDLAKTFDTVVVEATAQGQNVAINGRDAGPLTFTAKTSPDGRLDVDLVTGVAGTPQTLRATVELRKAGYPVTVATDLTNLDLAPLVAAFAPDLASSVAGTVTGRLRVAGPIEDGGELTLEGLQGELALDALTLTVDEQPITIQTPLTVTLASGRVTLPRTRVTGSGVDVTLGGALGIAEGAAMDFAVAGTINLAALPATDRDTFLGGSIAIDARLQGTTGEPRLGGEIRASDVSYSGTDLPLEINGGNGRVTLAGKIVTLESFTARANDGTVDASGTIALEGLAPSEWRFEIAARDVDVLYEGALATVNGNFTLTGDPTRQLLFGTARIPSGEYTTDFNLESLTASGASGGGVDFEGGGRRRRRSSGFGLPPLNLAIRVEAPETLLIRNQQVNTVASAALNIGGTIDDPSIEGRVSVEGGTIKFRTQRYEITTGTIDFPGGAQTPFANFLAEGDVSGYHVYVGLFGPIDEMEVVLRSDPDLPRADVLSLVTTGRTDPNTLLSQDLVASGLGTVGSLLSEEFISQPAQSLLGLNRFAIDPVLQPNSNPAARLTVGKQITRDLAFTYSTNVGTEQDQTAIAEYTVTNRFSAIAAYTQGGNRATGGQRDSDFTIEVRGRKRFALGFAEDTSTPTDPVAKAAAATLRLGRQPLPEAEVTVEPTPGVSLSGRKLRELLPVETDGFSRPLARLGERNLTNYLQEKGYFFATVRSRCEPADCSGPTINLLYDVEPGQRYELKDIRIEGTDLLSKGDVEADLQSKEQSFFGGIPFIKNLPLIGGYARGITSDDRIRRDRQTVRSRMRDLGYRSARVRSRLVPEGDPQEVALVFTVEPGVRSTVARVSFSGNAIVASDELLGTVSLEAGDHYSPSAARETTRRIRDFYADRGYLEATAQYSVIDVAPDQVDVMYEVSEGARAEVAEVVIDGQTKTRESSIRRFVAFERGEVLTPDAIRRTQRDLYATGAFSEVVIRPEPVSGDDPNARKVTVRVTEAKPLLFVYGLGYSTDDGPRGSLQLTHTNLFGRVNTGSLRARVSPREQLAQIQFTDLRPFGTNWATTISGIYNRNSDLRTFVQRNLVEGSTAEDPGRGFGIDRLTGFIQFERKLSDITSLRLRYSYERSKLFNAENIPLQEIARNAQAIRLGLISLGLTHDTRDSALDPTEGQLISAEHSIAAKALGGSESFNKFFANYQCYKALAPTTPVLRDSVLAFSARIGLAAPFSIEGTGPDGRITRVDRQLHISQRFFAGGATTLRGFRFEQAGPQGVLEPRNANELPTLVPLGGDALVIFNFELRYPLTENLRLVPFYDLGNVFNRVKNISFAGMTHTVGLGLRVKTPLGPVGVDYGRLLDPPSFRTAAGEILRQPQWAFHIRFGPAF
jgi:outer membrane protein assembly complex protein YaeT